MTTSRTLTWPPRDGAAEPVCLLTREWAERRRESPDRFLGLAISLTPTERGIEYLLPDEPRVWDRIETFVEEEGECCPFLAFEAKQADDVIRLSIVWPEGATDGG